MKNVNRVYRSGGIRRMFDKPPPRLLKMHRPISSAQALLLFSDFCAVFPPFALAKQTWLNEAVSFFIILNHMQFVKCSF